MVDFAAAAGFHRFDLLAAPSTGPADGAAPTPRLRVDAASIVDERLALACAADGTLTLTDRASGRSWSGLGWFEDQADLGDTYDFRPLAGDVPRSTRGAAPCSIATRRIGAHAAELVVTSVLHIPIASTSAGRDATTGPPAHRRRLPALRQAGTHVTPLVGEGCLALAEDAGPALPRDLLAVSGDVLVVTALKTGADGSGTIVRMYNPTAAAETAVIALGLPWTGVAVVDLGEERCAAAFPVQGPTRRGDGVTITVGAYAVLALRFI